MDQHSRRVLANRYEWISYHLEREAYAAQMKGRNHPIKQFTPCSKATVFTAAMYTDLVSSVVIHDAAITPCQCHRALSESDLWNLFDRATAEFPTIAKQED